MPAYVHGNHSEKIFIVVLHGAGSYGLAFRDGVFRNQLEQKYVVVYFDQRAQSMAEGNFHSKEQLISTMASDVDALTKVLKKRYGSDLKLFLMGHSLGGLISAESLLSMDLQTQYLGWINVDGLLDVPSVNNARQNLIAVIGDEQQANSSMADEWVQLRNDALSTEDYDGTLKLASKTIELLYKDEVIPKPKKIDKILQATFSNNPINWFISNFFNQPASIAIKENYSLLPQLTAIEIPSLFIYGKYDVSVPPNTGRTAFLLISSQEKDFVVFDQSIHHPHDTEPDKFGSVVSEFIEKHK
ncbi:hypothetical protein GCM10007940_19020 [Portibacter lacus]|uniref:Serine aminopeptidase S33 domain-containing protein n=2 Tax=Portibacter lacus TaxID=1099794 RepID=A0AA37SPT8_9BACT|nr:hypothetical protein GCM10007940_19020 [Portibacter lacus]